MKIEDAIDNMSKSYLERIIKSYTTDIYEKDEEGYKKQIRDNIDFFSNPEKIRLRLNNYTQNSKKPYQIRLLLNFVLKALIGSTQHSLSITELINKVKKTENDIIKNSKNKEYYKHLDEKSIDIFETILSAALEDEYISEDELYLINKVRKKLGFQVNDQYMIEAKLNHFPKKNNQSHSDKEINQSIIDLQKHGIIFYCNLSEEQICVIPDELIDGVKSYLKIELVEEKYKLLLENLNKKELQNILDSINIKYNAKKEDVIDRISIAGIKPSEALNELTSDRISEICTKLPEIKVSGTKNQKIERIIKYYDSLINVQIEKTKDKRKIYYDFYEQLAKRDLQNLLGKKIIKQERDIDLAFEDATTYLFQEKLNHEVISQEGTDHSDGCMKFRNGDILLWDNKSINGKYTFPNSHLRQFKRYIRDISNRGERVGCFLIIVPDFEESAKNNALKLKYESSSDTDISIISAEDLKMLAEEWSKNKNDDKFNLEIFNTTGLLTREELKNRKKIFL